MKFKKFLNEDFTKIEEAFKYIDKNCQPYLRYLQRSRKVGGLLLSGRNESYPFIIKNVRKNRQPKDTPPELHRLLDEMFEDKFGVRPRSQSVFCNPKAPEVITYGKPFFIFPEGKYTVIWSRTVDDLWSLLDGSAYELVWDEELAKEKAQYEWEEEFREGLRGYWKFHWKEDYTYEGSREEAAEYFTNEILGEIEDEETKEVRRDNYYNVVWNEMKWVPEVSEADYVEERIEELQREAEKDLERDIIDNYTKGELDDALTYNNEIMLMCRRYVGIDLNYFSEVEEYLRELHQVKIVRDRLKEYKEGHF